MKKNFNKQVYTIKEFYNIVDKFLKSYKDMKNSKKLNLVTDKLENQIMLVVTEVNGCKVCSYVHTKHALKLGMSDSDIKQILSFNVDNVELDEGVALFFAQYYASSKGKFDNDTWNKLVNKYGEKKAKGILGFTRKIMMGNVYGIAVDCLKERLKRNSVKESSLLDELGIVFGAIFIFFTIFVKQKFTN